MSRVGFVSAVGYTLLVAQCPTEKFAKKLLGESEIEAVLQRLDRLTQDEARMTVTQTLGVVDGLVGSMKVVMEGAECLRDCYKYFLRICFFRWQGVNRWYSTEFGYVFCMKWVLPILTWVVVALHEVLNNMNKLKRLFYFPHLLLLGLTVSCR